MRSRVVLSAASILVIVCASLARAQEAPLPAFRVLGPEATIIGSDALAHAERWLLVYVLPGSEGSDRYLRCLKRANSPLLPQKTVLLLGGNIETTRAFVGAHVPAELQTMKWYADIAGEAWQALGLSSAPVVLGMQGKLIYWMISGVFDDPRTFESAIRTWVPR